MDFVFLGANLLTHFPNARRDNCVGPVKLSRSLIFSFPGRILSEFREAMAKHKVSS